MNYLRKHLVLTMVCIAMLLTLYSSSNAQYRRSGISVNISYGQPYYRPYTRYVYRRPGYYYRYRPRYYTYARQYRPVYYRSYYDGYDNVYYLTPRRKYKRHRSYYYPTVRYVYNGYRY
jgi:hypothetical protein